jgi:hypothetical protein
MTITPISQLGSLPEQGRIRVGVKSGKGMKAIDTFRFTSRHREPLDQLASQYGGSVKKWHDPRANPPNQFELITEASEIEVLIQPGSVSCDYELWGGGGLQRRCDGVICTQWFYDGNDSSTQEGQCICFAKGLRECKPITRVQVIFPSIDFGGTWRYESGGMEAATTLPNMLRIIEQLQLQNSLMKTRMRIEQRERTKGRQKRKYNVVTLATSVTVDQIMSGEGSYTHQIRGHGSPVAIEAGKHNAEQTEEHAEHHDVDDQIIDAELVEEDDGTEPPDQPQASEQDQHVMARAEAFALAKEKKMRAKKVDGGWVVE